MQVSMIQLNDGRKMPQLGYGVWKISDEDAAKAVKAALATGYRHIDTAMMYKNEAGVGEGIRASDVKREDVFLASKVWNSDHGYDNTLKAFEATLKRLQTNYLDLYFIHWPVPTQDLYVETWKALIELRKEGRVKSIGVCNFRIVDLERLIKETGETPAVNQIELHPLFQQNELRVFHGKNHIATEAWAPLGRGALLENEVIKAIASEHKRSAAQIILRWHMEIGNIAIPKSQSPERMAQNFDIFDFTLSAKDHERIAALDDINGRSGADPAEFS